MLYIGPLVLIFIALLRYMKDASFSPLHTQMNTDTRKQVITQAKRFRARCLALAEGSE